MYSKSIGILILCFMFIACEEAEEAKKEADCAAALITLTTVTDSFNTKFDNGTATKAECDDLIIKAQAYSDCLPEGEDKTEMLAMIAQISSVCAILSN